MKRKRSTHATGASSPKRRRANDAPAAAGQSAPATLSSAKAMSASSAAVQHPVLRRLYPEVCNLRHYVLSRLPGKSKNRRRRIAQVGRDADSNSEANSDARTSKDAEIDRELAQLLDSTLIGICPKNQASTTSRDEIRERSKDMITFSQQLSESRVSGCTYEPGYFLQAEVRHLNLSTISPTSKSLSIPLTAMSHLSLRVCLRVQHHTIDVNPQNCLYSAPLNHPPGRRLHNLAPLQAHPHPQTLPPPLPELPAFRRPQARRAPTMSPRPHLHQSKQLCQISQKSSMVSSTCFTRRGR